MLKLNIILCTALLNVALRWCGVTNWVCDLYLLNVMIVSWYARCLLLLRAGEIMERRGDHHEPDTDGPTEHSEGVNAEERPLQNLQLRKQSGSTSREFVNMGKDDCLDPTNESKMGKNFVSEAKIGTRKLETELIKDEEWDDLVNVSKEDYLDPTNESKMDKYFVSDATLGTRKLETVGIIKEDECDVLANGEETKQTEGNTLHHIQDSRSTTHSAELMSDSEESYIDVIYPIEEAIEHLHKYEAVSEYMKQMTHDVIALDTDAKGNKEISDGLHDSKQETGFEELELEGLKHEIDAVKEETKELNSQELTQNTVAEEKLECTKQDSNEVDLVDRNTIASNQAVESTKINDEDKNKVPKSPTIAEEVENEVPVQLKDDSKDENSSLVSSAKNNSYNWNKFMSTAGFNVIPLQSFPLKPSKTVPTGPRHTESRQNSINNSKNTNKERDDLMIDPNTVIHQDTTNTPPHQTLQNGDRNINKVFGKSNRSTVSYWLGLDANPSVSQDLRNKQSHQPLYDNNNSTKRSSGEKHEERNDSLVELSTVALNDNGGNGCLSLESREKLKNNSRIIWNSLSAKDSKEEHESLDSNDNESSTADHETYKEEENECPPTLSHDHTTDNYKETMNPDETSETEYETPMFQDHNTNIDEEKDNAYTQNNMDKIEDVYFKDERNEYVDLKDYNSPHREPTLLSPTPQNNNNNDKIPDEHKKEYETKKPEEVEDSEIMDVDIINRHRGTDLSSSSSEVVVEDSEIRNEDILSRHKDKDLSSSSEVVDSKDDHIANSLTDKVTPPFCGSDREGHRQNPNYLLTVEKADMKDRPVLLTGNFTTRPFNTERRRDSRTQNEMGVPRLKNRSGARDYAKGSTGDGIKRDKDDKKDKDMDLSVTERSGDSNEDDQLSISSEESMATLSNSEKCRVATVRAEAAFKERMKARDFAKKKMNE